MVHPKKHLGQHFLTDESLAERIVNGISLEDSGEVIEVGPGTGVLTKYLIERYDKFQAFDVDQESIDYLKHNYSNHAAKFLLRDFLKESISSDKVVVIGNFPYNISSQLFFKIWDERDKVDQVVCMVQKEVAKRIASAHGNKVYGILSVLLQAFYDVEYLFSVPPGAFNPPPKVQSGVIRLTRNKVEQLPFDENEFKKVVKMAFGKRRKTLRNALKDLALPSEFLADQTFDRRAEQLSIKEFIELVERIEKWKM